MNNSESGLPVSRVIYDPKRVKRVEDYGEAVYRSQFHKQTIPDVDNYNFPDLSSLQDYITDQFFNIKKDTEFRKFFPHAKFDAIITPEIVLQLVNRLDCYWGTKSRHKIAQDIYYGKTNADGTRRGYRKLLAAMILAEDDLNKLKTYIEEGMSDDCLPVFRDRGSDNLKCRNDGHRHQAINRERRRRGPFLESFIEQSKQVMIPLIEWHDGARHHHYVMKAGGILPIVFQSVGNMKGDFGEVTKVKIDPSDGWFGRFRTAEGFFALKRIDDTRPIDESARETEFDLEVRSLLSTKSRTDRDYDNETKNHLIQLLATFEVYEEDSTHPTYYLLFPWADGNLEQFWREFRPKHSARRLQDLGWMVEQFMRLGKALQCIHNDRQHILLGRADSNRFGRHGDIKPANFLYFKRGSGPGGANPTLVLADFGLGRLQSKETRSKDSPSEHLATVTYQAPEYEIQGGKLSPRSDIFSLGCVFLEYITWLLRDADAIEEFNDLRIEPNIHGFDVDIFYTIVDSGRSAILKESVKRWIYSLEDHPDCVEVVGQMLELIHHRMLDPDPATRITSAQLVNKLVSISNRWQRAGEDCGTRHWKLALNFDAKHQTGDSDRNLNVENTAEESVTLLDQTEQGNALRDREAENLVDNIAEVLKPFALEETHRRDDASDKDRNDAGCDVESIAETDLESVFSGVTLPSLATSAFSLDGDIAAAAIAEFGSLLCNNADLQPLYPTAISKFGPERFERNFARMLKRYGTALVSQAKSDPQRQTALFAARRKMAGDIAAEVLNAIQKSKDVSDERRVVTEKQQALRQRRLETWFKSDIRDLDSNIQREEDAMRQPETEAEGSWNATTHTQPEGKLEEHDITSIENASVASEDELEHPAPLQTLNLEQVKEFLTSADAFHALVQELRAWVDPQSRTVNENNPEATQNRKPASEQESGTEGTTHDDPTASSLDEDVPRDSINMQMSDSQDFIVHIDQQETELSLAEGGPPEPELADVAVPVWRRFWENLKSPTPPGYTRHFYECGCGDLVYLDLKELSEGGIDRFKRRLLHSTVSARAHAASSGSGSRYPTQPSPVHLGVSMNAARQTRTSVTVPPANITSHQISTPLTTPPMQPMGPGQAPQPQDARYLLLCVNTSGGFMELAHTPLKATDEDEALFAAIAEQYHAIREEHEIHLINVLKAPIKALIPGRLRSMLCSVLARAPRPPLNGTITNTLSALVNKIKKLILHRITSGDFVKFHVVPFGDTTGPAFLTPGQFPPEEQVSMKRYLYEPVPIEDAEVRQLPVVHLLKPGRHSKDFWIKRLPKKLKDRLVWDQNVQGDVIGWGVRINEEVNRGLVHLAFFVLSLVLVVGVGIYIKLTGKWDNWENQATAWGFGGFVVALLAFWDYLVINSF